MKHWTFRNYCLVLLGVVMLCVLLTLLERSAA